MADTKTKKPEEPEEVNVSNTEEGNSDISKIGLLFFEYNKIMSFNKGSKLPFLLSLKYTGTLLQFLVNVLLITHSIFSWV